MDTISRENNSMLPVGGIIVGVIALLLGGYAAISLSKVNKALADVLGIAFAMWTVAGLTFLSGLGAALRMRETLPVVARPDARPLAPDGAPS